VERQELYVTNTVMDEILVFPASATGNVAPIRVLKGPRTGINKPHGVFVDEKNDEIVVANFGNHAATVYPRSASGDVAPKRMIRAAPPGTPAVMFGNIGALAYDTRRNEIVVPNCVAYPRIATFGRDAAGGAAPNRQIAGQATRINRGMHDVTYDAVNDEIIMANPFAQAILVFRGGADGDEAPIRVIQGPKTQMAHPDYAATVDPVHNEIYVVEKEYILVFPRTANGDVAPVRVIRGPDTKLVNTRALVVDPVRNLIITATRSGLLIFDRTADGNAKPKRIIGGRNSMLGGSMPQLQLSPKGWIVGSARGEETPEGVEYDTEEDGLVDNRIGVWHVDDNGDVPPAFLIGGPRSRLPGPRIALNPNHKELIVGRGVRLRIYSLPEIF
jgi:DNA-binding beta-propeller fold protein YncE